LDGVRPRAARLRRAGDEHRLRRHGTIAFAAPARVPIRKKGDGWLPAPGWTGAYDWTGYIPFEQLPHAVDPSSTFPICPGRGS
jgi:hypothetical protein